jgi:hypothetical protein
MVTPFTQEPKGDVLPSKSVEESIFSVGEVEDVNHVASPTAMNRRVLFKLDIR